jgi:hypothetical protein
MSWADGVFGSRSIHGASPTNSPRPVNRTCQYDPPADRGGNKPPLDPSGPDSLR